MYCMSCGKSIIDEALFCPFCGNRSDVFIISPQPKQEIIVEKKQEDKVNAGLIILTFFLPLIGIIYGVLRLKDNQKKSGKIYLIFGIVSIFINIILIVCVYLIVLSPNFWLGLIHIIESIDKVFRGV